MTEPVRHTVDTITDNDLAALYAEIDHMKLLVAASSEPGQAVRMAAAAEQRARVAEGRTAHADDYALRQQTLVNRIHDYARTMRPADASALWRAMGGSAGGPRKLTPAQEETAYRIRAAASTVVQARRWAARAEQAEAANARVREIADRALALLDEAADQLPEGNLRDRICAALAQLKEPRP